MIKIDTNNAIAKKRFVISQCVYRSITAASRPPQPGDMAEPRLSMCKNECEAAGGRWTYTETEMNDKCTCTQGR